MKRNLFVTLLACLMIQAAAFAQDKYDTPEWVSNKGYWVVESNIHAPKKNIFYFYNNDGVLVYKEKIDDLRINPSRRATRMLLKKVLETAVLAWENKQQLKENDALVVNCLRKK